MPFTIAEVIPIMPAVNDANASFVPSACKTLINSSVAFLASLRFPSSPSMRSPMAFPRDFKAPPKVSRAALADPPNWTLNSSRIIAWASASRFVSTSPLIISFWSLENWMPDRLNALKFATGSFSALPNWTAADLRSVPILSARSSVASVVAGKISPWRFVKVKRIDCILRIASSP